MLAESRQSSALVGSPRPRIAPPLPARSDIAAFRDTATGIGITLMPWQETAARYIEAKGPDGLAYREVAVVVARQNGKSEILVPLIVKRLLAGRRIVHTAQDRAIPREVFYRVAEIMWAEHSDLFPLRNGRPTKPRFANGQEEIRLTNGGRYRIVAPNAGARGGTNDDVIVDEVRELDDWQFVSAAKPTMTASPDPQIIYLSNAGDDTSVVLNALRDRADKDPALAYLEWSSSPERPVDDRHGWVESNPAISHLPAILPTLERELVTNRLAGTLALFETEHLCRWVVTMREALVGAADWNLCETAELPRARKTFMAVSMDPDGKRASAALSWQLADGRIGLRMLFDVTGDPIDTARLGADMRLEADKRRVAKVGFDPMTDAELAKFFRTTQRVTGNEWSNASAQFVNLVEAGRLRWHDCAAVTDDLTWTARKDSPDGVSYQAVRARDDRPITSALAAIRAVWLASGPRPPAPRVY